MAGVTLEYNAAAALAKINAAAGTLESPRTMFLDMGEFLLASTERRFSTQTAPDGSPWKALSPAYQKRKRKNKNRILVLEGYLKKLLRYQASNEALLLGSDRVYAAIHQLGGTIDIAARSQQAYFKQTKKGVGNRFVKKSRSNFAQRVTIGPYTITMPARPYLGVSAQDEERLIEIATYHLEKSLS
ncbi:MAG: phage virion morphogenesis protein [Aestuariibacter sp.]|nr:phage virion morphogenesis protein [Halieaceae bacterium]MCP5012152.1 phage virion morphogenesis protein [Aestuariibacter sp.]